MVIPLFCLLSLKAESQQQSSETYAEPPFTTEALNKVLAKHHFPSDENNSNKKKILFS